MNQDHWLMLLLTPRWFILGIRGSSSPKARAITELAPLPHVLLACSAGHRATHCRQETATAKPNFLIPARAGCDGLGSNGKLHHVATLPSAQLSGRDLILLPVPCPEKSFLSLFCSIWHLKACILYCWCRPSTKGAINCWLCIQGNLSSDKFFPKYEINQPAGAQDAASASSSKASTVQAV